MKKRKDTQDLPVVFRCKAGAVFVCLAIVLLVSSCSPGPGYLFPSSIESVSPAVNASLELLSFSEDFLGDGVVGSHVVGGKHQQLRVMKGEIGGAMDALLRRQMRERGIAFLAGGQIWDMTVEGLGQIKSPVKVVVGCMVSRLSVEAVTGFSRVSTNYTMAIDLECRIGLVGEKKVVKRRVRLSQKMLRFSSGKRAMTEVLDQLLWEAGQQVAANVAEFIDQ